jgi:tetratricopeptide (TPR) repeat protein
MSTMSQEHPDPQILNRLLHEELSLAERRQLVRHLLSGCSACLAAVRPLWGVLSFLGHGQPRIHPASYQKAFDRAFEVGRDRELTLARERLAAPPLCSELLQHAGRQRLEIARSHRRFHTVAVCELLTALSRQGAATDAAAGVELAELALAVAGRLDAKRCGRTVIQALQSAAWGCLGEARRRLGDLAGAERCLQRAEDLLPEVPTDPLERPELWRRKAALALDQGHETAAEALLERAGAGYSAAGDERRKGQVLVERGLLLASQGRREEALARLGDGLRRLDEDRDLPLLAAALYALAEIDLELGRGGEALLWVQRLRPLCVRLSDECHLPRLCWLEGKVERSLGHPERAEWAFQEARAGFTAAGAGKEAALVAFDLAILYAQQNRWPEIRALAALLFSLLGLRDVRREAMAAFLVFQRTVEREGASLDFLVEVAGYLVDARWDRGCKMAFQTRG